MKGMDGEAAKRAKAIQEERGIKRQSDRNFSRYNDRQSRQSSAPRREEPQKELSLEDALAALKNKFNKH